MEYELPILNEQMIIGEYKIEEQLEVGSRNYLFKVTKANDDNKILYVMKVFPYETSDEIEWLQNELMIMEMLKGNSLFAEYIDKFSRIINVQLMYRCRVVDQYEKRCMFLIMKYYENKDLAKISQYRGLNENLVIQFLYQALKALKILSEKRIVHNDIKPGNFLLVSRDPLNFALIDFEFAEILNESQNSLLTDGTSLYKAPEILNSQTHNVSADMWSLGVSAYKVAGGCYPYRIMSKDDENEVRSKIENCALMFKSRDFRNKSEELKILLSRMLEKDPNRRITPDEALQFKLFEMMRNEEENECE